MSDQAEVLRSRMNKKKTKVITITSGKGGVGKSNFTTNTAIALKEQGMKPLILDADFGLANVEIIFGARPKYSLAHLIQKTCSMKDLITISPQGIPFISGGTGIKEMLFLDKQDIGFIAEELGKLDEIADVLLVDTGAGINDIILKFSEMADEVYLVVTPEPASITDAYALVKTLVKDFSIKPNIKVVINKAESKEEANQVFKKLSYVAEHFLQIKVSYGGYIPYDHNVFEAVKHQQPITQYMPKAKASYAYRELANKMTGKAEGAESQDKGNWVSRFKTIFSRN